MSQRFGTRRFTIFDLRFTIYDLKISGLRRYTRMRTLTADGGAGDTPTRFFTQNTMPLCRLRLFSHKLWDTHVAEKWTADLFLECLGDMC